MRCVIALPMPTAWPHLCLEHMNDDRRMWGLARTCENVWWYDDMVIAVCEDWWERVGTLIAVSEDWWEHVRTLIVVGEDWFEVLPFIQAVSLHFPNEAISKVLKSLARSR
jgi:hypothetical protein